MCEFNKKSVSENYKWFSDKLSDDFHFSFIGKSKVIFGYNGIGKSTLFKCIKESNNTNIEYIDYVSDGKDILPKDNLVISTNINSIIDIDKKLSSLDLLLNASEQMKTMSGITSKAQAKGILKKLEEIRDAKTIDSLESSKSEISDITKEFGVVNSKVFFKVWGATAKASTAKLELQNAKGKQLFNALSSINNLVSSDDKICPVCDTEKENLKVIIEEKMKRLSSSKSELCEMLADNFIPIKEETVESYIGLYDKLKNNNGLLTAFALCGGSEESYEKMANAIEDKKTLIKDKNDLLAEAKEHYLNVKKKETQLKHDLLRYFKIEETNVQFDDEKFLISIAFPRKIETYSTGEINLIIFLYRIYSFLGSDKTTLVLDDPVSSLDLLNHYKIAYELVKTAVDKTIIILTHSAEFLNTINSQYPSKFDFLYLEECSSRIRIQPIEVSAGSKDPNIISLERLTEDSFVKALKEREMTGSSENIDVFHYTIEEKFLFNDPEEISNHKLIKMIDDFSAFSFSDFYKNTTLKIEYICALRVWIEYRLFKLITDKNKDKQASFLKERDLNGKINIIFPRDESNPFSITKFSRDDLMSKKVMLNQGSHYFSQVMPMAYSINISFDQLSEEIVEFRRLFK